MLEDRFSVWLETAIAYNATDIHCHFQNKKTTLQMRTINGLKTIHSVAEDLSVYQYLKYKANLDLSMAMTPQTGTFEYIIYNKIWYCRFSAMETMSAKSGVLRILNLSPIGSLNDISSQKKEIGLIQTLFEKSSGLLLFSGTTGSGKSTTMFTGLNEITGKSIYTLEDPVERIYESMMQMQVNHITQFDFNAGIKQLLRHDPDIMVIGEIRSPIEARAAVRACLSGHLVCSTIHSSSAIHTLYRLIDFKISFMELAMLNIDIVFQKLITTDNKRSAKLDILCHQEVQAFFKNIQSDIS